MSEEHSEAGGVNDVSLLTELDMVSLDWWCR